MTGQKISMSRAELLAALQVNRDRHRTVFEAALEGYRDQVINWLGTTLDKARANVRQVPVMHFGMMPPEDHTRDYDRIIAMIKAHTGDTLDVDESTFASYVLDDWGWKRSFLATSSSYAAATVMQVYGEEES